MQRIPIIERSNLKETAANHGFEYAPGKGVSGWNERAYYQFSLDQIEGEIEKLGVLVNTVEEEE